MANGTLITKRYFDHAPQEIQDFLTEGAWQGPLKQVAERANLNTEQQTTLENETVLYVLGLQTIDEYPESLARELGISQTEAEGIAKRVQAKVLYSILPLLDDEEGEEQGTTAKTSEKEVSQTPSSSQRSTIEPSIAIAEEDHIHHELIVPSHLEPMIVPQQSQKTAQPSPVPRTIRPTTASIPANLPTEASEEESMPQMHAGPGFTRINRQLPPLTSMEETTEEPSEMNPAFNRHDILGDIENPETKAFVPPIAPMANIPVKPAEPTLKNPMPLYDQKLTKPVRNPRQENKVTDPYREEI